MDIVHATSFQLTIDWNDQGQGEEKGVIRVEVIRDNKAVAEWCLEFAPHDQRVDQVNADMETLPEVLEEVCIGDHFRLSVNTG